ncbi:DUF4839 domain-containing protein [Blastococcus sp. SYSU D00669]
MQEVMKRSADADDDAQYEFKSVRAVRGTEARTIAKWQKAGWEIDTQSQGSLLRTELTFRRVKPKAHWRLLALAVGVVLLVVIIVIGVVTENQSEGGTSELAASPTQAEAAPSERLSADSTQEPQAIESEAAPTQSATEEILTAENNEELAALLEVSDPGGAAVAAFASKYQGRTIEFDGNIASMLNHGEYETRYDILVGAGDFSETAMTGPYFQFRDVNITNDLHLTGSNIPDFIGRGDNLHIIARVVEYDSNSQLFLLEPISTEVR